MRITLTSKIVGMVSVVALVMCSSVAAAVTPCPLVKEDVYTVLTDTVFAVVDLDGNGFITVAEVEQISPELAAGEVGDYISKWPNGISRWWFHRALETFDVMSFVDLNDDGLIAYSEVSEYISEDIFAYIDMNGNGVVDCEDWARITEPYAAAEGEEACGTRDMLALIVNGVFRFVDLSGNGEVSFNEVYLLAGEDTEIVFGLLDRNNDDVITEMELFVLLESIPLNIVNVLDMDADGSFQRDEVSFVPDLLFLLLDRNHDDVLDCTDAPDAPPEGEEEGEGEVVIEGEEPPIEGEEPPVEGEAPVEGEGEPVETPCPLPTVSLGDAIDITLPYVDVNGDGGVSLDEILAIYPGFEQSWFDDIDLNNDGVASRSELLGLVTILHVYGDLVFLIDMNGDRLIQYEEVDGYLGQSEFEYLDNNGNGVVDCEDYAALLPDPEGEEPPVEGEEPPVEGEVPVEGEGEVVIDACPLPPVYVEDVVVIGMPYVDINDDGGISMEEITAIYPAFDASWFTVVDTNDDALVTPDEILSIVGILPVDRDLVLLVDDNDDRLIQFNEVSTYLEEDVFDSLDLNANGVWDCEDLAGLLPPMEGEEPPVEGEEPPMEGEEPPVEGEEPVEGEGDVGWGWVPFPGNGALSARLVRLLQGLLVEMDADGDSTLTYEEVASVLPLPENLFVMLDADGDGLLTHDELNTARRRLIESYGEPLIQVIRTITGAAEGNFYLPGMPVTVTLQLLKQGADLLNSLDLMEVIPEGWTITLVDKADAQVSLKSDPAGQLIHFEWEDPQAFPITVSYTVTPPADAKGMQTILGQTGYDILGDVVSGEIIPTVIAALLDVMEAHSADSNHDWRISLRELLRVIQLFNSIGYHCFPDSEDGYAPGAGDIAECLNHLADYNGDWIIDLSELLRLIQLYNSDSGYYYISDKTEDGYMVVPF